MKKSFSIVEDKDGQSFDDEVLLTKYSKKSLESVHSSPGPSRSEVLLRSQLIPKSLSSDSDISEDDDKKPIPGEYNPADYENLEVEVDVKEIFQYITKYIPQLMNLEQKFKPFIPEFLPGVGDIDAFLKVIAPTVGVCGDSILAPESLGLTVLDEPAANQSDAALLHLQLRAESVTALDNSNDVVVKTVGNIEKNGKIIEKWIKDISALHKSKSLPTIRYTHEMPDLDELMEEWPDEELDREMRNNFPEPKEANLDDYIDEICVIFGIPAKQKIEALYQFFSLFAAVKSTQIFKKTLNQKPQIKTDHLLLE